MVSTATQSPPRPQGRRPGAPPPAAGSSALQTIAIDPRRLFLQYWMWLAAAGFIGLVLGVAVHFALLHFYPIFTGRVYFEFRSLIEDVADQAGANLQEDEMERFIGTQLEQMTSETVLQDAATSPQVRNETEWIKSFMTAGRVDQVEARRQLEDIADSRLLPNTNIGVLSVRTTKPRTDAATLANAITDAYLKQIRSSTRNQNIDILTQLKRQINNLSQSRTSMERQQEDLFGEESLDTLDERSSSEARQVDELLPLLVNTEYNLDLTRERLAQYEEQQAAPGGPIIPQEIRAQVDEEDPIVQDKKAQLAQLRTNERAYKDRYGPNHREVRRIRKFIEAAEAELEAEKQRRQEEQFASQIELLRNQVRSMEATLAETSEKLAAARLRLSELNTLRKRYEALADDINRTAEREVEVQSQIDNLEGIGSRQDSARVIVLQRASVPEVPTFPIWYLVVLPVALLCSGGVFGIIVLRELLEQRVRGPADLAAVPHVRVLGVIPDLSEDPSKPERAETVVRDHPAGVSAECIRHIRNELVKRMKGKDIKTVLVAGGMPGSGGTSTVINLATTFAAAQRRVLVIDANLRRPRIHSVLDRERSPGLTEALLNESTFENAVQTTDIEGLSIITAGRSDGRAFDRLTTDAIDGILSKAREQYDLVLIDVPPTIVASDALTLAADRCDAVVLVVRAYSEKRGLVNRMRTQLQDARAELLGVVINAVRSSAGGYFRRNFQASHEYQNGLAVSENGRASRENRKKSDRKKPDKKSVEETAGRPIRIESLEKQASADDAEHGQDRHRGPDDETA